MEVRVCLMFQPLSPWGNNPHYPLNRRLGGNQSWFDVLEKRKILFLLGIKPHIVRLTTYLLY
jgi:hypothetical protein